MREKLAVVAFSLIVSLLFLLGVLLVLTPIYALSVGSLNPSAIGLSAIGTALIVLAILLFARQRYGIQEITVRGKTYSIKKGNENKNIRTALEENPSLSGHLGIEGEDLENYSEEDVISLITSKLDQDPLQQTINEISKQISVIEYLDARDSGEGLKIVRVDSQTDTIIVNSEVQLSLVEGLIFNVFTSSQNPEDPMERVARAVLMESQSTSGDLFEFEIYDWKYDDPQWIRNAKKRLENNYGRVKIIREGIIDDDKSDLQVALNCVQKMKNVRDREYEY